MQQRILIIGLEELWSNFVKENMHGTGRISYKIANCVYMNFDGHYLNILTIVKNHHSCQIDNHE